MKPGEETTLNGVTYVAVREIGNKFSNMCDGCVAHGNLELCTQLSDCDGMIFQIDRKTYEEDLKRRQEEHLKNVQNNFNSFWKPCLHDGCSECHGTGVKLNGSPCVHNISCNCPKCTPIC